MRLLHPNINKELEKEVPQKNRVCFKNHLYRFGSNLSNTGIP